MVCLKEAKMIMSGKELLTTFNMSYELWAPEEDECYLLSSGD